MPSPGNPGQLAGIIYLLHFDQLYIPYPDASLCACAGHYTGYVRGGPRSLKRRLAQHGTHSGAKLMLAVREAGITWQLARTWPGTSARERQLKQQGGASRRCPLCGVIPRPGDLPRNVSGSVSRSLATDSGLAAAGLMTAAEMAAHTDLRRGAVTGKTSGVLRLGAVPGDDPWYAAAAAGGGAR